MLSLFKKNAENKSTGEIADVKKPVLGIKKLGQLMGYFPIGKKLQYCPEFMNEVMLDTIIIAYSINDELIYSLNELNIENDGKACLIISNNGSAKRIEKITEFSFIVPYHRDNEIKLDYNSRSTLGRNGPFTNGNNLTLIAARTDKGAPNLDAIVIKRVKLDDCYYSNHTVIYLKALPRTLTFIDQRKHQRFNTNIPVLLQIQELGLTEEHHMLDFAENSAQLALAENSTLYGNVTEGQEIIMTLNTDDLSKPISLIGKLYPKSDGRVVIILSEILKDGEFSPLDMLDKFEIKNVILNHPATELPEK